MTSTNCIIVFVLVGGNFQKARNIRSYCRIIVSKISATMIKYKDENIVIQLGEEDKEVTVATHFPRSCINEGESLFITHQPEKVEAAQDQHYNTVHSRGQYSVFYIDTGGGQYTKTKTTFLNKALKKFRYLCVYGVKGWTVEEALQRDGRFIDALGNFTLSHNKNPNCFTECTQRVDQLHGNKFKICLLKDNVTTVLENSVNNEEIYKKLRDQFPSLKELMEKRFPGDSYQRALDLRKEDFGKIQQSFSEVHRVRELIEFGKSVCKVVVVNGSQGTGFVLFDNFILTNAHILKDCVEGRKLKQDIEVYAFFNYDVPEPHTNYNSYLVKRTLINYSQGELDYAILEIKPEDQMSKATPAKVPPGLLDKFGPMPPNGEACIIGHPAGGLKKMDPTCIIEKEQREQAVQGHLHPYRDAPFILYSIAHLIGEQGIDDIMMGGNKADEVVTYHTFMYRGSSGSPVFDAGCRVFGLHTSGFVFGFPKQTESPTDTKEPTDTDNPTDTDKPTDTE
uniref:Serine protease n=1 Tax=Cyclopterus lumpus TaxID=8103 RepID=A0A8C3G4M4_CYCLU